MKNARIRKITKMKRYRTFTILVVTYAAETLSLQARMRKDCEFWKGRDPRAKDGGRGGIS